MILYAFIFYSWINIMVSDVQVIWLGFFCFCICFSFLRWQITILWSHCFGLWVILSMDFKARVDLSSPALCSHLRIMILRVNSEFPGQGLVPVLHLDMVRLLLEWLPNVTSRTGRGRFKPRTSWPKARRHTNWAIPVFGCFFCLAVPPSNIEIWSTGLDSEFVLPNLPKYRYLNYLCSTIETIQSHKQSTIWAFHVILLTCSRFGDI